MRHYMRINVVRLDPESDIHKDSYDITKIADMWVYFSKYLRHLRRLF